MPTLQPVEDEMNEEAAAAAGGAPTLAASATPKDSAGKTIAPKKPGLTQPQLEKDLFPKLRAKAETKLGAPGSSVPAGPIIIKQPIASAPPKPKARAHQKTAVPSASTSRKRVHQPKKIQPTSTLPLQQRPKLPLHGGRVKLPSTSMSPQQYIAKSKLPLNNNGAPKPKSKFKLPLNLKGAAAATKQHPITEQTKNVPLTNTNKAKRKSPLPLSLPRTQSLPTTTTKPKRKPPPPPGPPPATWPGPAVTTTTTTTTPKSKVTTKALLHCQLNMKRPPPPPGPPPSPSEGAVQSKAKTTTSSSSLSPSTTKRNNNNLLPTTQQQIAHQKSLAEQRRREAQKQTPITLTELDMNEKEINESKSLLMCFLSGMDDEGEKEEIIVNVSSTSTSLHVVDEFQHNGRNHDKAYHYSDPTRLDKKMKGR